MFSVRWSGKVKAPVTGTYTFKTVADDGVRLWVDNQILIDQWKPQVATEYTGQISLIEDNFYDIKLEFFESGGEERIQLYWSYPGQADTLIARDHLYSGFIENQSVNEHMTLGPLSFTVDDMETSPGSLNVSGTSSNTELIPNGNIVFGGSGRDRTVTITPGPDKTGISTITIILDDGSSSVSRSFDVTVNTAYTVTYHGNGSTGGSVPVDSTSYQDGESATILGNTGSLVRTGYTFAGWNTEVDGTGTDYQTAAAYAFGAEDVNLYAMWSINQYTLTYTAGANGSVTGVTTQTVNHGSDGGEVEAVAGEGYHFVSWSDGVITAKRTDRAVTDSLSVTASFAINRHTVSFNTNEGSMVADQSVSSGGKLIKPADPHKAGYTFGGWYKEASYTNVFDFDADIITTGTIIYAKWTAIPSSGGGDSGGTSGSTPAQATNTITGRVIDNNTGTKVSDITATVVTESNGSYVSVKYNPSKTINPFAVYSYQ